MMVACMFIIIYSGMHFSYLLDSNKRNEENKLSRYKHNLNSCVMFMYLMNACSKRVVFYEWFLSMGLTKNCFIFIYYICDFTNF